MSTELADLIIEDLLPRNRESFALHEVAKIFHCSTQHFVNLIESGELRVPLDLRNKASSRAMIRVPRSSLVEFVNRRSNFEALAALNARVRKPTTSGGKKRRTG